jgi:hypothetical protein
MSRGVGGGGSAQPSPPTISSISPDLGDVGGGITVTITGTNLTGASSVTVGGTSGTSVSVVSSTSVTFVTPAKAAGTYDVAITTPSGSATLSSSFESWYPTQITGVSGVYDATLGVTGTSVSGWADQKGTVGNLAQITSGSRPVATSSSFGSRTGIVYDGGDNLTLAAKYIQASGRSLFVIGKWTSSDSTQTYEGDAPLTVVGDFTGDVWTNFGMSAGSICFTHFISPIFSTFTAGSGLNDGTPKMIGVTHDQSTGDIIMYLGTAVQGSTNNGTYNAAHEGFSCIGAGYLDQDGFTGTLAAVIIVDQVISVGDKTKLNKWSVGKWGTS